MKGHSYEKVNNVLEVEQCLVLCDADILCRKVLYSDTESTCFLYLLSYYASYVSFEGKLSVFMRTCICKYVNLLYVSAKCDKYRFGTMINYIIKILSFTIKLAYSQNLLTFNFEL